MNMLKKAFLLSLIIGLSVKSIHSQDSRNPSTGSFSTTVNPSFFILGGYSIKGFYHLPKKWTFGIAAEASFELPEFARNQFFDNENDINVNWDYLVGIEARFRFTIALLIKACICKVHLATKAGQLTIEKGWKIPSKIGTAV
ncbi:hypothetical protein [Okeania hirsuta]|nr:hypothetical protein [Okeania hirsuta]